MDVCESVAADKECVRSIDVAHQCRMKRVKWLNEKLV